jgi:hypothetical protein
VSKLSDEIGALHVTIGLAMSDPDDPEPGWTKTPLPGPNTDLDDSSKYGGDYDSHIPGTGESLLFGLLIAVFVIILLSVLGIDI